ncbi:MAG: metallophosphoesterase [Endomicrobia bacterium]|nr:metallophosphoesterase [Endomicrobiia bacterium]
MNKVEKLTTLLTLWEYKKTKLDELKKKFYNFTGKIAVISDLHIPFCDVEVFNYFVNYVKKDKNIKIIVIAGDFVNFDRFSRYLHFDGVINAHKEINIARTFIIKLVKLDRHIVYLKANHELRLEKFLIRNLGNEVAEDLLNLGLALENFFKYKNLDIIDNWFIQLGRCIIAHPEAQSIVKGRVVDWIIEYFETRIKDFGCVVVGHTHRQSKLFRKGKLGIEVGSMCKTLDYTIDSKFTAYRTETQYKGFGIILLNKGYVDVNNTNFIFIKPDEELL